MAAPQVGKAFTMTKTSSLVWSFPWHEMRRTVLSFSFVQSCLEPLNNELRRPKKKKKPNKQKFWLSTQFLLALMSIFFWKISQNRPFYVYFRPFLNTKTNIVQNLTIKSVDGVLGTRIPGWQNGRCRRIHLAMFIFDSQDFRLSHTFQIGQILTLK